MPDAPDPYKILQVDSEAEDEVIQAAYRRLARKYHPDLAEAADAASRMAAINAAWELIGGPDARKAYDQQRAADQRKRAAPPAGSGLPPRPSKTPAPNSAPGSPAAPTARPASPPPQTPPREPETTSGDWTAGRSTQGHGYDESMRRAQGHGAAGPPPGQPSGTLLNFGRYAGWSMGEVARHDLEYIEWLDRAPIGRNYRQEIDEILRKSGRRRTVDADAADRRGLYRRR
jgi:curved DNA-binding protein CbpA